MALYFKDIEITNIDNLVPQSGLDVTDIWFCSTNVYTVWEVYEGTLPATINANGDDMRQYQIYGNTGGVGDKTENLFDGVIGEDNLIFSVNGGKSFNSLYAISEYIKVNPSTTYTFSFYHSVYEPTRQTYIIAEYSENYGIITPLALYNVNDIGRSKATLTTGVNTKYIKINLKKTADSEFTLIEGTDESYIPYGYEVDMSVSDGTNTTTTPIYIGSDPLEKDEYVDYKAGKVYRRTEQLWNYEKITVTSGERYGIIVPNGQYSIRNDTSRTIYYVLDYEISGEHVEAACAANSTATLTAQSIKTSNVRFYIGGTDILQSGVTIVKGSTIPSDEIPYYQPTDPPVALPALPTCEGTTIVDYAGSGTAPEKVLLKYRKENF